MGVGPRTLIPSADRGPWPDGRAEPLSELNGADHETSRPQMPHSDAGGDNLTCEYQGTASVDSSLTQIAWYCCNRRGTVASRRSRAIVGLADFRASAIRQAGHPLAGG